MKTEKQKNGSVQAMEQTILKEVPFIVDYFLGKGLINVVIEQLKSARLFVLFTFKDGGRFTRIRVSIDKDLCYVVSVVNNEREVLFMSFSKYDSDFKASLFQQCSCLADLPF